MNMNELRELPPQVRLLPVATVNEAERTVELVWSQGADVTRTDWWTGKRYIERLSMDTAHVDLSRMQQGAPVLNTHSRYDVRDVIGVVERAWIEGGEGRALVRFSDRDDVEPIWRDIKAGILRNVSVGYVVRKYEITENANELPVYRAVDWQPFEVSMVPVGADAGAGTRSQQQPETVRCEFIHLTPAGVVTQERTMPEATPVADTSATTQRTAADQINEAEVRRQAAEAERQRGIDIRAQVRAARLKDDVADDMIARGISADAAAREILQKLVEQDTQADTRSQTRIETLVDETETRRAAMTEAIVHRMAPHGQLPERAREFRHMSLLRMAEESLGAQGIRVRGMSPLEIASRALHSTSDFPHILANVMNKRLRAGYDENMPSYTAWARRAPNAPDFKTLSVVQLSAMPDLLAKAENGEFKYGTLSDGKETYSMLSYGRILGITRETLINDDLRAFDRIATGFSASARRLENRMVYAQITGNPTMADGVALFHSNHGNLAGSGAAISATTLAAGRTAMRLQKGLQAEELNLAPRFLIVPATQEQLAYQYTSTQFVPAKSSDVNEFRQGGRTALEPIVESILDASSTTAWYLAGDNGQVDTVEYCYLEGAEGVRLETAMEFDTDGMKVKAALDFVAKVIDHRGLYKNAGA